MNRTWKYAAFSVLATLVATLASLNVMAQDPAAKFAEWAPKMTAENMADEGQVKEMEKAQVGWMELCLRDQNDRATTNKIMLDALKGDYPVVTKAWLLHILGWVGDDSCVDGIAAFLTSEEAPLFDESARALAHIATNKAINALKAAQAKAENADKFTPYIKARDVDLSVGVESEIPLALPVIDEDEFEDYMKKFDSLDDDAKARALGALRVRKDDDFVDLAVKAVASENADVKKAALLALEKIGDEDEFQTLYEQLSKFDRGLVENIMKNIDDDDFDEAVVKALKSEKDGTNLASLAKIVAGRYIKSEVKTLLDAAKKDDCPARFDLIAAAETLATKDNVGDFVDVYLAIPRGGERDRAEQIISRLCDGDATPVIAKMNNQNGPQVFLLLGRVGGAAALEQIEAGLKSNDPNMIALSVRALCNWPNATVYEKLLDAAKNKDYPEQLRIQALRAFIRVVSLPDEQDGIDMSGADKLKNLKIAFDLATRNDERNLVLERVGSVRELASVEYALKYVDTPELQNKALNAILDLAHHDYLRKQNKELFIKALDVVLEKGDQGQKDRAGNYKKEIR
ncbi:MAG: hypothetical protein IJU03_09130 [Thermoguttaceae bacterium]|nr:hypothetical protein [Thermoguttaceae bacterium]